MKINSSTYDTENYFQVEKVKDILKALFNDE